jgi:hypothetical protein
LLAQLHAPVNIDTDTVVYVLMCDMGGVRAVTTASLFALPVTFAYAPLMQIVFIDRELAFMRLAFMCSTVEAKCARC